MRRYAVRLFFDRTRPEVFLPIADFRIAEAEGQPAQHFLLRAKEGTFRVSFDLVNQIEFLRVLDVVDEGVRFEARVSFRGTRRARVGEIALRSLEGIADGMAWQQALAARPDRGAALARIVFQETP